MESPGPASHWTSMYIGVSTLLLGKSETTNHPDNDDTTETSDDFQDDFFENDADSLDDSRNPNYLLVNVDDGVEEKGERKKKTDVKALLKEREQLREQVLTYHNTTKRTTQQRRMSRLDHEVLHSALTMEITMLQNNLKKFSCELEREVRDLSLISDYYMTYSL